MALKPASCTPLECAKRKGRKLGWRTDTYMETKNTDSALVYGGSRCVVVCIIRGRKQALAMCESQEGMGGCCRQGGDEHPLVPSAREVLADGRAHGRALREAWECYGARGHQVLPLSHLVAAPMAGNCNACERAA